jgi:hypothetical protein
VARTLYKIARGASPSWVRAGGLLRQVGNTRVLGVTLARFKPEALARIIPASSFMVIGCAWV